MRQPAAKAKLHQTKTHSIFRRLTIVLTTTIGLIAIIIVGTIYLKTTENRLATLNYKADEYLDYLTGSLKVPLWNVDLNTIEVIGSSFAQNELITSIVITSLQPGSFSQVVFSSASGRGADDLSRSASVLYGEDVIGAIEFSLTQEPYQRETMRLLRLFGVATLLILLALLLVSSLLLRWFFKKPLDHINTVVNAYGMGLYDQPEPPIPYQEFKTLEAVLTEMGQKIKAQMQELKTAEEKYRSIFENALEGIYQATPDGRFVSANPAAAHLLGYENAEQLLQELNNIGEQLYVDQEDRRNFLRQIREKGSVNRFVAQCKRRGGETIWLELSARAIFDSSGTLALIEGQMADITAQKRAEAEQERLQQQLQHAQKMESLGNLAGGIAHDFNNLLQAMSGYIQLLLMKKRPDDPEYKYLTEVDRAAMRASDLVKRLLTFSRKMEIDFQPLDLNELVQATVGLFEHTLPKMVAIETDLDPDLPVIHADASQIEQVLLNLANNGVDAMQGAGTLKIVTRDFPVSGYTMDVLPQFESRRYILLEVSDTGCGMNGKTQEQAFDPFYTTKQIGKGSGLGLSTVYGIVKGHQGHIHCTSEPDAGTTMTIFLPVDHGELTEQREEEQSIVELPRGTETILLVDDEETIRDIAEDLLTQYGYHVLKANSGENALEVYARSSESIDLIVMDLGMPGMGGERCLHELKTINPEVKVIVASGYASHRIATAPLEYGAAGFLSKPYKLISLLHTVRSILDE